MLLGKRPRPPIRRTTSMTSITVDPSNVEIEDSSDMEKPMKDVLGPACPEEKKKILNMNYLDLERGEDTQHQRQQHQHYLNMVSSRNHRRSSFDFMETAHFLRTCGLCNRRLASGRDIYIYRGDTAFCSLECREKLMKQDERKDKCIASNDEHHAAAASSSKSKASSGKRQTVAAV